MTANQEPFQLREQDLESNSHLLLLLDEQVNFKLFYRSVYSFVEHSLLFPLSKAKYALLLKFEWLSILNRKNLIFFKWLKFVIIRWCIKMVLQ